MAANVFTQGGGAGIGSYVVVFKNGQLDPNTDWRRLRGAYEAGDQILFSIIDEGTEAALVSASGWIDEEQKLHLVARDFDDNKTYAIVVDGEQLEPEVSDGIEMGGGEVPTQGDVEEAKVKIEGNSLVIPEQPAPEPVFVDPDTGVAYFHKKEFDLEELAAEAANDYQYYDLLTGELTSIDTQKSMLLSNKQALSVSPFAAIGLRYAAMYGTYVDRLELQQYTSRSLIVVDTMDDMQEGDNTKICLPECSAYYGFLSADGKTFISYYNLKSDGAPSYVDSIKQGNAVIPLKDVRLPDATAVDVGKVLAVNEDGELVLQQAPAGGTKLYKHVVSVTYGTEPTYPAALTIITTDSRKINEISFTSIDNILFIVHNAQNSTWVVFNNGSISVGPAGSAITIRSLGMSNDYSYQTFDFIPTDDTVTPL